MSPEQIEEIAIKALNKAYQIYEQLRVIGAEVVRKNRFGEVSLRVDIEAERAVISTLREADISMRVDSEEHGVIEFGEHPTYLGVLDGLDGSGVYKRLGSHGRYGTMFGIFSSLDPQYCDYIFSGVMEHPTERMFVATKGKGSYVIEDGKRRPIHCSDCRKLDNNTRIYIDEYWEVNRNTFSKRLRGFHTEYLGSSAVYYVDLASGVADLVLECTRKANLEIAVAYGLVAEAGGVMVTENGIDLGQQRYLEFGRHHHEPIISASSEKLAEELLQFIL